jgi:hypothetical protein
MWIYGRALEYPFSNLDDPAYIASNPLVRNGLSLAGIRWAFGFDVWLWHPLTIVSLMLDADIARWVDAALGQAATEATLLRVCRIGNILLHLANAALVGMLARRLLGDRWQSLAVAALFALHPLRVEAVVWICERKELLSATFGLSAVLAFIRYADGKGGAWYIGSVVLTAVGLMTKPTFVTMPGILLLLDVWPLRRADWLRLLQEQVPFLLLSAAATWLTCSAIGDGLISQDALSPGYRLQTAIVGYATYVRMTGLPWPMTLMYPLPFLWPTAHVVAAAALLIVVTGCAVALRRAVPAALFGWLWFLGTAVPTSGIFQNGTQAYADRFTYVPSVGLLLAVVAACGELFRRLLPARPRWSWRVVFLQWWPPGRLRCGNRTSASGNTPCVIPTPTRSP